jgi:hypothetical protein|tara:strand:+ start:1630 stop:2262 length:633 start_codon:yes stop_codon:yes gene_type:complete
MAIQNTLPDPSNQITDAGQSGSGSFGPGFQSVKLTSVQPIMRDRTNSGRIISRSHAYHKWEVQISYNPLTKDEFDPIYTFLMDKRGSLQPFFVSLPQYKNSGITSRTISTTVSAGKTTVIVNSSTNIKPGMLFTIADSQDTSHTKAYMVTQVSGTSVKISPALAKNVVGGAALNFADPKLKVIQTSDTREYTLNTNNLYSFALKLEEVSN